MSSLIQSIAKASQQVFGKYSNENAFIESLNKLRKLCAQLTAADVGFSSDLIERKSRFRAPSLHVEICTNDVFSIGIFVLPKDGSIPLHDHQQMHGIVKVIHGTIKVKSFSFMPNDKPYTIPKEILSKISYRERALLIPTHYCGEKVVGFNEETTCLLTPTEANLHEIESVGGIAAFLDILAPPYESGERECQYYQLIDTVHDEEMKNDISWLMPQRCPPSFWCESLPYQGPKI
ncbi:2-aminoethanethiol dioxygenase-like protein [Dinothrombium tinctorium]|uniref:2-aminoethanethiol dioxygenase-like protein n=1 Tax=Dinothrombium tinctorium TaxID=1965070 RepID=A0A3S3PHZ1_9ACAR|nr:2-aminoethanethiol dioxygenase-like protein [Dinothrombium tinctorium]